MELSDWPVIFRESKICNFLIGRILFRGLNKEVYSVYNL